jgi:hypothetical protein
VGLPSREGVLLRNAGHVGPYASLTCLLILMTSRPHGLYCADRSIVLIALLSVPVSPVLLFRVSIVLAFYCLDSLLIVHPSLVEQLAYIV